MAKPIVWNLFNSLTFSLNVYFRSFSPLNMVPEFSDICVPDCIPTPYRNTGAPSSKIPIPIYRFRIWIGTHHYKMILKSFSLRGLLAACASGSAFAVLGCGPCASRVACAVFLKPQTSHISAFSSFPQGAQHRRSCAFNFYTCCTSHSGGGGGRRRMRVNASFMIYINP